MRSKIFFMVALFATVFAQSNFAQDNTKKSQLSTLLPLYYDIKNALVKDDAATASAKAGLFSKAVKETDMKTLSESEMNAFMSLQNKLSSAADKISSSKDIQKQRDNFAALSSDFYTLAKAVKLSDDPVYQAYCPMKKSYWLSSDAAIKNPYYGKAMLTCGSIKDTIK